MWFSGKKKSEKPSTLDQPEKYLADLLGDDSDIIYGSQARSQAKSKRKEMKMKGRTSPPGDIIGYSMNENVKQKVCEKNHSRNEIRNEKKRASSDTSSTVSSRLLSLGCGDIDRTIRLEDLEEADLLALPLSQRLRLRSLQSASSSRVSQPRKLVCSEVALHNFSSDSDEEILLDEKVHPQPLGTDPFDDEDEIISGLLDHNVEFGSKVEQAQYIVGGTKKDLSGVNEFVNEMASMSIVDDVEPTLKLNAREHEKDMSTILCTETTGTVCLDVDDSTLQSKVISNAMTDGTIVADSTIAHTVCLEVGDSVPVVPKSSFEDRLLGVTQVANATDTVCIEISEKDERQFVNQSNQVETLHCQTHDLTQVVCDDTLYSGAQVTRKKSKILEPRSDSNNVTRGYFDLNPDFTVSVAATSAIDRTETDMTLIVSASPDEASDLKLSDKNDNELNVTECISNVNTVLIGDTHSKERQEPSVESNQNFRCAQDTLIVPKAAELASVDEHPSLNSDQMGNEFDSTDCLIYDKEHTVYLDVENTPTVSRKPYTEASSRKPYTVASAPDTTVYVDVCSIDSFCETNVEGKFIPRVSGGSVAEQTAYKAADELKSSSTKLPAKSGFSDVPVVSDSCAEMDISLECNLDIECRNHNSCSHRNEQDMDVDMDTSVTHSHQHITSQKFCGTLDVTEMNSKHKVSGSQPTNGYSNQVAGSNFIIESSLLNYCPNKTKHAEMNSCSSESNGSPLSDNCVVNDLDKYPNQHKDHLSNSENEERKRNKKLNSKQVNKRLGSLSLCSSNVNTEESVLELVDNVISSQAPKKRSRQKKFKREDLENFIFEEASQGDDISLLDLVDDVISSTQGTKATIKVKKTKKLKSKSNKKLRSLQNIDPNVFS